MKPLLQFFAAAAVFLAGHGSWAQALPEVAGEPAIATKATREPQLRLAPTAPAAHVRLGPVPEARLQALREANQRPQVTRKRLFIGVTREMEPAALPVTAEWLPVPGGHAKRIRLTSPGAASVRLGLDLKGVPLDVEMVFFGSDQPGRLEGPVRVGDIADRTVAWWSPLTEGETQTVELFAPNAVPAVAPHIESASHVLATPSSRFTKRVADIGDSGSCNVDVACSSLASQATFREITNAVAQMVFNDGGLTGLCTGTLLNDTDASTQAPWFYSANHCFDESDAPFKTATQLQTVATTLATLWFFEAASCGSTQPANWVQLSGGATVLYNNVTADVLFMRLNNSPPPGAFYAGWNANALAVGASVVTVHHPSGDLKKVSQGSVLRFATPGVFGGNASFIETRWSSGTTEGGSSGAGVWSTGSSGYSFRGGLYGGSALCTNPTGTDYYSRFDQVYPSLSQYLSPPAQAAPITDFTDMWWNPAESGWGMSIVQHATRTLFAVWYTYGLDGKRTWYVLPSGTWVDSRTYSGTIYATSGPAANAVFDASRVRTTAVGNATLRFTDSSNGTFTFNINGLSGSKLITRQPF